MYADEALYAARINPWRPCGSLTKPEIERLHYEIRRILWAAIENKGASVDTYFRPDGSEGSAHYEFKVAHGLGGKTCAICGGPIERVVVRNRGTYFCPKCQPMKK
jgi:formamidopyrimidine-DNA glycosylase